MRLHLAVLAAVAFVLATVQARAGIEGTSSEAHDLVKNVKAGESNFKEATKDAFDKADKEDKLTEWKTKNEKGEEVDVKPADRKTLENAKSYYQQTYYVSYQRSSYHYSNYNYYGYYSPGYEYYYSRTRVYSDYTAWNYSNYNNGYYNYSTYNYYHQRTTYDYYTARTVYYRPYGNVYGYYTPVYYG